MAERLLLKQTNGVLYYDEKYDLPELPVNYKRSDESPYVLLPILQQCSFREYKTTYIAKCGCKHSKTYCNHFKTNITLLRCMECKVCDGHSAEAGGKC